MSRTHSYVVSRIHIARWLDKTPACVWCHTLIGVTWLIHMFNMLIHTWYHEFICARWLDKTPTCVWCHALIGVTWHIEMCSLTHSHAWLDAFIQGGKIPWDVFNVQCESGHGDVRSQKNIWEKRDPGGFVGHAIRVSHSCVSHSHVWHGSFICVAWPIHMCDISGTCDPWGQQSNSYGAQLANLRHPVPVFAIHRFHMCCLAHRCATNAFTYEDISIKCVPWCIRTCDMTHLFCFQ